MLWGSNWMIGNAARQVGTLNYTVWLFTNELLESVSLQSVGCTWIGISCNIICYVDDIVLLSPSKPWLELLLDYVSEKIAGNMFKSNVAKTCHTVSSYLASL